MLSPEGVTPDMVVYNYTGKEINAKVVYYGPALSGKTTNLEWIYSKIPVEYSGKMVSLRTQADRTIFFDFLPLDLGVVDGFRTRFMLYTVPGQVHYNATRKMVLKGVDGVVFVADSEPSRMQDNIESLQNLRDNLEELGIDADSIPLVLQWNKRDLPNGMDVSQLERELNPEKLASFEACALTGEGVYETLHALCQLIYRRLSGGGELDAAEGDGASLFGETIAQCLQEIDERPSAPVPLALDASSAPAAEKTEADDASVLAAILGGRSGSQTPAPAEVAEAAGETSGASPATTLGQALDDRLGQESLESRSAVAESTSSDPDPADSPEFEQPVDVIAELQSLSADAAADSRPSASQRPDPAKDENIDLDLILSEEGSESSGTAAADDGDLGLIQDPRRLPTESSSHAMPSLNSPAGSSPLATAPTKTRILEVPVSLDPDVFEDGKSLRIVLNLSLRR
jgi:hypothetical protein